MSLAETSPASLIASDDTPTSVYLYYDRAGLLLYVGITKRGIQRNREHDGKLWWRFVTRQEVEHFPSRHAALRRESELIRGLAPPFNKQQNPRSQELQAEYLRVVEREHSDLRPFETLQLMGNRLPLVPFEVPPATHGWNYGFRTQLAERLIAGDLIWRKNLPHRVSHELALNLTRLETVGGVAMLYTWRREPLPDDIDLVAVVTYATVPKPCRFTLKRVEAA